LLLCRRHGDESFAIAFRQCVPFVSPVCLSQRSLEYLFYAPPIGMADEGLRVAEYGFRTHAEYHSCGTDGGIALCNALSLCDSPRLEQVHNAPPHARATSTVGGSVVVTKVYLARSVPAHEGAQLIKRDDYPDADAVYRTYPQDARCGPAGRSTVAHGSPRPLHAQDQPWAHLCTVG
jgi:hypothetical protein